jgi:hypothetical protein
MKNLFFTLFVLLMCSACEKEESTTTPSIIGKWRFQSSIETNLSTMKSQDILMACQNDDIIIFEANGKNTVDHGSSKCDPLEQPIENYTWKLINDNKNLIVEDSASKDTFNVDEISSDVLRLSYWFEEQELITENFKVEITLKRIK